MSLLDDVSIVVTPNGYKAGELYAVVPVPIEGAELITNGDFATDSDWTKTAGWTISGGSANCVSGTGKTISQSNKLIIGRQYKMTVTVTNYSSGYIGSFGDDFGGAVAEANGIYEVIGTATQTTFGFVAQGSFTGSIDNVSVKEYTSADMDVTRATAATRVDEAGLVNYAEIVSDTELVTNGDFTQTPLGTGWTVADTDADNFVVFDGSTARLKFLNLSPVTTLRTTDAIIEAGKTYKLTVDVAVATSGGVKIDGNGISETFNTIGVNTRIIQPTSNTTLRFYRASGNVDLTFNSVSLKEVTRDNVPRIDYSGGGCPHILAEPQSTNLNTNYNLLLAIGAGQVSLNNSISPDGTQNATKLTFGAGLNDGALLSVGGSPCVASTVYTFSFYAKSVVGDGQFSLRIDTNTQAVIVNQSFTATSEWARYSHTFTSDATATSFSSNSRFRRVTASNEILFYGMQLEKLSYSTSIIPTSGSTVTRNQDQFSRDGIGSLINSTEGVLFAEIAALVEVDTNRRFITLNDGGASNNVVLRYEATGVITARYQVGGVAQCSIAFATTITNSHKIAFKYKVNDFALWIDGTEVGTDTSGSVLAADTINKISFDSGNGSFPFNGKVKQLQVYKTALTDAQLTSLTS